MGEVGEVKITKCPPAFTYKTSNDENIALKPEDREAIRAYDFAKTVEVKENWGWRNSKTKKPKCTRRNSLTV